MEKSHLHHPPTEVSRAWGHVPSLTVIYHSQDSTHATALLFWLYISHQSTLLNARRLFFWPKQCQKPTPLITSAKKQTALSPYPRGQCPAKHSSKLPCRAAVNGRAVKSLFSHPLAPQGIYIIGLRKAVSAKIFLSSFPQIRRHQARLFHV